MLYIKSITKWLIKWTAYNGTMATIIQLAEKSKWKIWKPDTIIEKIKEYNLEYVLFRWSITENPDIKPIITWLSWIRYKAIVETDASDSIEPIRNIKWISFIIHTTAPTEKTNTVNLKNFQNVKAEDEVIFELNTQEDYDNTMQFLKNVNIIKPIVTFVVPSEWDLLEKLYSIKTLSRVRVLVA